MEQGAFIITGRDEKGRRIKRIYTDNPEMFRIYKGTVWQRMPNGRRKKLYDIMPEEDNKQNR